MNSRNNSLIGKNHTYSLLGAVVIGILAYVNLWAGYPTLYAPLSLTVILPAFFISDIGPFFNPAVAFLPLLFIAWTWRLDRHEGRIPVYSVISFLVLIILSILMLIVGWRYGLEFQGTTHTIAVVIYNLLFYLALFLIYFRNRKNPTFRSNFVFHLVFFIWLAWASFPWLGELI